MDAKVQKHFFESFASELKNGLHSANVASRRDPQFCGRCNRRYNFLPTSARNKQYFLLFLFFFTTPFLRNFHFSVFTFHLSVFTFHFSPSPCLLRVHNGFIPYFPYIDYMISMRLVYDYYMIHFFCLSLRYGI